MLSVAVHFLVRSRKCRHSSARNSIQQQDPPNRRHPIHPEARRMRKSCFRISELCCMSGQERHCFALSKRDWRGLRCCRCQFHKCHSTSPIRRRKRYLQQCRSSCPPEGIRSSRAPICPRHQIRMCYHLCSRTTCFHPLKSC